MNRSHSLGNAYDRGLRSARRGDRSEALVLLNWPDALVRIAGAGPPCHIQADPGAKIRRRCHLIVTLALDKGSKNAFELGEFEPLTFCMPYKSLSFRNVAGCGSTSSFTRCTLPAVAWYRRSFAPRFAPLLALPRISCA